MAAYTRDSITEMLRANPESSIRVLKQQSLRYPGLFSTSGPRPLLEKRWYSLLFDDATVNISDSDDDLEDSKILFQLQDGHFQLLCGENWKEIRESYLQSIYGTDKVLDHGSFDLDLSNVQPPYALSKFNLLSQNRGVKVVGELGALKEISPISNLAVSLTLNLVKSMEDGMFLWQQKLRRNPPRLRKDTASSDPDKPSPMNASTPEKSAPSWQRVPDIVYYDFKWLLAERTAFCNLTYREQQTFVCADLRLQSNDIVLPFVVDFPGETLKDDEDARVTADIDGQTAPLAAISLPGAAFIGWVEDMIPDLSDAAAVYVHYRKGCTQRKENEFLLSTEQKEKTRVRDQRIMVRTVKEMYRTHRSGARVFYKQILYMLEAALSQPE